MSDEISSEITRLQTALGKMSVPDPIDLAVVEALSAPTVKDHLEAILAQGAHMVGSTLSAAGSTAGVVLLTFETQWNSGSSRLTPPDCVSALVELSPPKVLKVEKHTSGGSMRIGPFTSPTGPVPPVLKKMSPPLPSQVLAFQSDSQASTEAWLKENDLTFVAPGPMFANTGTGYAMSTSGSSCSSLLCSEHNTDDGDYAD